MARSFCEAIPPYGALVGNKPEARPPCYLPSRKKDSHKGNFGRVGIVAGSLGMSGAAVLCGTAAVRSGAGLVTVFTPKSAHFIVALGNPCYMASPLEESEGILSCQCVPGLLQKLAKMDVVAVGPGCGTGSGLESLLQGLLSQPGKLVLDADALNQLAQMGNWWSNKKAKVILTPHPGEMQRLTTGAKREALGSRMKSAKEFAKLTGSVVLLKGHQTVIANCDQENTNQTGNPGMAKGGSGDVLTGIIAALWGQGLSAFDSAQLGAFVHGMAGDFAAKKQGQVAMLATDLLMELGTVFETVKGPKSYFEVTVTFSPLPT
ncbi:MAG: NAD(P)H-hydrate dehydratase [Gemmataceae bacterium]